METKIYIVVIYSKIMNGAHLQLSVKKTNFNHMIKFPNTISCYSTKRAESSNLSEGVPNLPNKRHPEQWLRNIQILKLFLLIPLEVFRFKMSCQVKYWHNLVTGLQFRMSPEAQSFNRLGFNWNSSKEQKYVNLPPLV